MRAAGKRGKKAKGLNNSGRVSGRKKFLIALLAVAIAAGAVFVFANQYLFKVRHFNIGENSMYTREQIIAASGISEGDELFGFSARAVRDNIKRGLGYAESVSILRLPPSTLVINIRTGRPAFGFMLGMDYYIITENFMVAEKISMGGRSISEVKPPGVINIVTDYITRCFVGEQIEFSDGDILDFLKELLRLRRYEPMAYMISSVDIRDKFNVVMNYSGEYLVRFGVFENVYAKAAGSFDVIKRLREQNLTGVIDMSDGQVASFVPDENISSNRLYFDRK